MEKFKIGKETISFYGKKRGSNSNKFNRVNKLASNYNNLHEKFLNMAERGKNSCTENYRCSIAVLLLMETGIRVGNETSAEGYNTVPHPHNKNQESKFVQTYGLTTLLREHVINKGKEVKFNFSGKKQVENWFTVPTDIKKYVIDIYNNCECDPLFGITVYQLTKFIKKFVGKEFSPKDFRTLRANIYAEKFLFSQLKYTECETKKQKKETVKVVCEAVSILLNNTPGVCKKSYIDDNLFIENLYA